MAKDTKKANRKTLVKALLVIVPVFAVLTIITIFFSRGEKIPDNPEGTTGNLAGNLNNGGIICESDGRVFFSNPYDGGALYSMNSDETDCRKISTAVASSINAAGGYIYYFQAGTSGATGLGGVRVPLSYIRSRSDGSKGYSLTRSVVVRAQLIGNTLYMEGTADKEHDGPYLFSMNTDGSGEEVLALIGINPSCASGNSIYYNNIVSDHNLMRYDTISGDSTLILEGDVWNPVLYEGYIYYMVPSEGYQLRRYLLSGDKVEILTTDRVESFNVHNGYIYYQTMGDNPSIRFMRTDGSSMTVLARGNYNSISMTSEYVYFKDFWNQTSLYHTAYGSDSYEPVNSALQAALEVLMDKK